MNVFDCNGLAGLGKTWKNCILGCWPVNTVTHLGSMAKPLKMDHTASDHGGGCMCVGLISRLSL